MVKFSAFLVFTVFTVSLVASTVSSARNLSSDERDLWATFKSIYNKNYESQGEELMRRSIFIENKRNIDQFNKESGDKTFSVALNHLSDLSKSEIKARNGFKLSAERPLKNSEQAEKFLQSILDDKSIEVPDELDWRKVPGRVTRVKNQGQCGSCWAFSTTGVLEGQEMVRNVTIGGLNLNDTIELSEQNLVDCVKKDQGCNGGIMQDALEFVQQEGGIDSETSYPYQGITKRCRFIKEKVAFSDKGAALLPQGDEQKLKEVVAKFGPVAVAIDASSLWFQLYRHGVYHGWWCHNKPNQLDHAVLVVGYGHDKKGGDYWIVKNSWGKSWGDHGYIKMSRNRGNNCGIATMATIPVF